MTYTFHGNRAELKDRIEASAATEDRDIYIDDKYPDRIEIGFERHGHSGGRFFYADITEKNGVLTLTGEAEDSYRHEMSRAQRQWHTFRAWAYGFLMLAFCALILWVIADDLSISPIPFWTVLLVLVVFVMFRILIARKEQQQRDDDFYAFLTRILQ